MSFLSSLHTQDDKDLYIEVSECGPIPPSIPKPYALVKLGTDFTWFGSDQQLIELHEKLSAYIDTRHWVYPKGGVTTGPVTEAETLEKPF